MLQSLISLLAVVLVALLLFGVFKSWFGKSWFFTWLKGSLGFICIGLVLYICLLILDLWSYKLALKEKLLAEVRIEKLDEQYFMLHFKPVNEKAKQFQILGDQWQVDMRLLTWKGPFLTLGLQPLYRFDRLSGRHSSIEHERAKQRTLYELNGSDFVDLWSASKRFNFGLHANYGSSIFMPMADKARYSIFLHSRGLVAKPANQAAKEALYISW